MKKKDHECVGPTMSDNFIHNRLQILEAKGQHKIIKKF